MGALAAAGYLAALVWFGDALSRRAFGYLSSSQRIATAVLVGLLFGSWASYLAGLALDAAGVPLAVADLVVVIALLVLGVVLHRGRRTALEGPRADRRSELLDWLVIGLFLVLVGWMMLSTYGYADGQLRIATGLWSDFGPTSAIAQSFALGDNFPTEYPHFPGEPIRYHFLYYFQVGNLTHLGFDPALANNVLSIATMVSMLALVIALGRRLFDSALVGRIGAGLFFLHGSLSFIPLLASYGSLQAAMAQLPSMTAFVDSGFPYRGEDWGIWTQMVFLNQRHFASGIGLLLVIVLFLLQELPARSSAGPAPTGDVGAAAPPAEFLAAAPPRRSSASRGVRTLWRSIRGGLRDPALPRYALAGLIAGLLPLWNGAVFIAAAAVMAVWLVLFPNRVQMLVLAVCSAITSIPQLLMLRAASAEGGQSYPALFWGYIIEDPTAQNVAAYLGFIFGPKLLLIAVALVLARSTQRKVFLAFASLVGVAFLFQLGVEVLANHKFINTWLVAANLFAAAGLVGLWRARSSLKVPARLAAVGLAAVIVVGGVIDFIPIRNQGALEFGMHGDRLFEWVRTETDPRAVFLSDLHVVHPILLAGRRLFFGWPYYAWSAGYDVRSRERTYQELLQEHSPRDLVRSLQEHGIAYVAVDDGLRNRTSVPDLNEDVLAAYLDRVFEDVDNRYEHLAIYRVPADPVAREELPGRPAGDVFTGVAVTSRVARVAPRPNEARK